MQVRKKEELSNRALGTNKVTEKMLDENVEKNRLDKKALKGLLWKNFAKRKNRLQNISKGRMN